MKKENLIENWLKEEAAAHIKGWDFSHIQGRYEVEDDLPWDYESMVRQALKQDAYILDIDTGGGEFLLSLGHPYDRTGATEAYPPNVELCRKTLSPLGIDFKEANANISLPFPNQRLNLFASEFAKNNFSILDSRESFGTIRFNDTGALIWFARIIEWEFPNFSVKNNLEQLFNIREQLEKDGIIEGRTHRFLLIARKRQ